MMIETLYFFVKVIYVKISNIRSVFLFENYKIFGFKDVAFVFIQIEGRNFYKDFWSPR